MTPKRTISLIVFCLLAISLFVAPARGRTGPLEKAFTKHVFGRSAARVQAYWTPRRIRLAVPVAAIVGGGRPQRPRPASSPTPTPPPENTDLTYSRSEIRDPSDADYRIHGKLLVHGDHEDGFCSATAMDTENGSVIFTAAHCLYDPDLGGWTRGLNFVPGYRNGDSPYGEWIGFTSIVPNEWIESQTRRFDYGMALLYPSDGETLEDVVGGMDLTTDFDGDRFEAYGYPSETPFDGERLYVCRAEGYVVDEGQPGPGPAPLGIGCDMNQGSSGGGWIVDGELTSVNSYGYEGYDLMFGPDLETTAAGLLADLGNDPLPNDLPDTPLPAGPAPIANPTRSLTIHDADDSVGRFDMAQVSAAEADGKLAITIQTHEEWASKLLSGKHPGNLFFVDLDTVGDPAPDYYVSVFFQRAGLVSKIYDYTDSSVELGTVEHPTRRDLVISFDTSTIGQDRLRFRAKSIFQGRLRCVKICNDKVPDRGMAEAL